MKRFYRAPNLIEASRLKTMLDAVGVATLMRNENMMRLAGEMPPDQCYPEVWIMDEADEPLALEVLDAFRHPLRDRGPAWTCPKCRERLEGQFSNCWNCGTERPV